MSGGREMERGRGDKSIDKRVVNRRKMVVDDGEMVRMGANRRRMSGGECRAAIKKAVSNFDNGRKNPERESHTLLQYDEKS